jgi:putative phage-type endonuclease
MDQRSEEWHEARRGKATGSMFNILMAKRGLGKTAETYAKSLIADEIQDTFEEQFTSKAMQNGIDLEPIAGARYEFETMNTITEAGFLTKGNFIGCSPDGLINDNGGIEIKCPARDKHISNLLSEECPAEYYDQIQGLLYIADLEWVDFVSYNPHFKDAFQIKIIRVEPNPEWVELFEQRIEEFQELINNYKSKLEWK